MITETTNTAGPADTAGTTTTITPRAFAFDSAALRVIHRNGEPWFVAKDVAACLGIANHWDMIERLDPDEKGLGVSDTPGGPQELAIITEPALYFIMIRCNGATKRGTPAHTFRRWVTHEVLPAIRKTGQYAPANGGTGILDNASELLAIGFTHDQVAMILQPRKTSRVRGQRPRLPVAACPGHVPEADDARLALIESMLAAVLAHHAHPAALTLRLAPFIESAGATATPWHGRPLDRPASTSLGMFLRQWHDHLIVLPQGNWRFHLVTASRSNVILRKV